MSGETPIAASDCARFTALPLSAQPAKNCALSEIFLPKDRLLYRSELTMEY